MMHAFWHTGLLILLVAPRVFAATPAQSCEAKKLAAAGKFAQCRLKTESKAVRTGGVPAFARCDSTFERMWLAADASGVCPTTGDGASVLALLAECTTAVPGGLATTTTSTVTTTTTSSSTLPCVAASACFCDLGNGTVLDTCSGLQWEKKNGADGVPGLGTKSPSNPHDVDNAYTWTDPDDLDDQTDPDGTMFTEFLAALNGAVSSDGMSVTGCFAGHCDWRLPQIDELRTLVDPSAPGCGSSGPCIDPIFGPTASGAGNYSSATTVATDHRFPWVVLFLDGSANDGVVKYDDDFVRAVRSTRPSLDVAAPKVIFVTREIVAPGDNGSLGFFHYPSRGDDICERVAAQNSDLDGKRFVAALCGREPDVANGADLGLRQRTTDSPGGYVRSDGARIADNLDDLLDGSIQVPISHDQHGTLLPDVESGDVIPVWSGCSSSGASLGVSLQCAGPGLPSWWFQSPEAYAQVGMPDRADAGWIDHRVDSCLVPRHLYCIEQ